jgi:hypothetical protein
MRWVLALGCAGLRRPSGSDELGGLEVAVDGRVVGGGLVGGEHRCSDMQRDVGGWMPAAGQEGGADGGSPAHVDQPELYLRDVDAATSS